VVSCERRVYAGARRCSCYLCITGTVHSSPSPRGAWACGWAPSAVCGILFLARQARCSELVCRVQRACASAAMRNMRLMSERRLLILECNFDCEACVRWMWFDGRYLSSPGWPRRGASTRRGLFRPRVPVAGDYFLTAVFFRCCAFFFGLFFFSGQSRLRLHARRRQRRWMASLVVFLSRRIAFARSNSVEERALYELCREPVRLVSARHSPSALTLESGCPWGVGGGGGSVRREHRQRAAAAASSP